MGAFPIQTDTACCDEWINDGKSGFIVKPDDIEMIADRIRLAVTDDALVDTASDINWQTVTQRLDRRIISRQVIKFYDEIFEMIHKDAG
jgi:glycosyltransferase involved in cell wall biosynthesis